jgi:SAM-dependent methyltransferase
MGTQQSRKVYGSSFFDYVDVSSGRSASAFLSRLDLGFQPASVLDVGCGRGVWLEAWKRLGVASVLGLDGAYVDPATLKIDAGEFRATDLTSPFDLGRKFDLVECLEVAEHLPERCADGLVASIVRHGEVVLFSSAPPGQGGEHHVNEQPLAYWAAKFAAHGFATFDCARPRVQGVPEIEPWYRYNALVFASERGAARLSAAARETRIGEPSLAQYASLGWRVRCAILRRTPRPVLEVLARVVHTTRRGA